MRVLAETARCMPMSSAWIRMSCPVRHEDRQLILDDYTKGTYALPDVLSYWTISDVFDESGATLGSYIEQHSSIPFGGVFGLINYQGLRKATLTL